jgi:hypothetical protein
MLTPSEYDAVEVSREQRPWRVLFFPQGLRLEAEDGRDRVHLLQDQVVSSLHVVDGLLARRVLALRRPRKLTLRLDPEGYRALRRWIGPAAGLRIALRARLSYALPIGTLFLLTSIPLPADPASGAAAVPFDVASALMGAALLLNGLLARIRPHRLLLLIDSFWFLALAAQTAYRIGSGASWLWAILIALQLSLVRSGIGLYQELAPDSPIFRGD